jgi:hypothetical protein
VDSSPSDDSLDRTNHRHCSVWRRHRRALPRYSGEYLQHMRCIFSSVVIPSGHLHPLLCFGISREHSHSIHLWCCPPTIHSEDVRRARGSLGRILDRFHRPCFPPCANVSSHSVSRTLLIVRIFYIYGSRIRRSCKFAREADEVGRALAARGKAAMGEESQIQSRISIDAGEVTYELQRAVSGVPNPGMETTLEMVESAEKKVSVDIPRR